jgi:hypothetical protein
MAIEFIGDAAQYFGFNKQVLVQIDQKRKFDHPVVNCRMSTVHCRFQTILYVIFCLPGV